MALSSTVVWEIRAEGNSLNGAAYDASLAGAGTDYTQQDAAELALTDCACANATNTTITSVTGGFTAAMIGNCIYISSGTNFTAGYYMITARTDTNTITVDRKANAGAADASAGVGRVGGAGATLETMAASLIAGNTVWIKKGTYSWGTFTTAAGSGSAAIKITGYNAARNDAATGANRPSITQSAVANFGTYHRVSNLIMSASGNHTLYNFTAANGYTQVINCKGTSTNAAAVTCFNLGDKDTAFGCEGISTNGYAFNGARGLIYGCYAHDSLCGVITAGTDVSCVNCVFDTCTTGVSCGHDNFSAVNCVFYNSSTAGFTRTAGAGFAFVNCIFKDCSGTGIVDLTSPGTHLVDWCDFHGNGTDVGASIAKGPYCIATDPGFTAAATGDFTISSSSGCLNTGLGQGTNTGVTGSYKMNIGVDQDDNTTAAGVYTGGFVG